MAAWKCSTRIDCSCCGGIFTWRFVSLLIRKYSRTKDNCWQNSFEIWILNHFLRMWKSTITTSPTSRQLATSYEILVARTEFLVALATRKAQFRTLYFFACSCIRFVLVTRPFLLRHDNCELLRHFLELSSHAKTAKLPRGKYLLVL